MAFERHRDKNGQMSRKHGNTLISTLRKHYGRILPMGVPIATSSVTYCRSSTSLH